MTPAKPILMSAGLGIYKSMSDSTKISWCDSTAGPWLICTEVSPGCGHCYARELMLSRLLHLARDAYKKAGFKDWATRPVWGDGAPRILTRDFHGKMLAMNRKPWICDGCGLATHTAFSGPDALHCPNCSGLSYRRRSFPSLVDWLDEMPSGIIDQDGNKLEPIEVLADFLDVLRQCDQMTHILCTKRPENWESRLRAIQFDGNGALQGFLCSWLDGHAPKNIILLASVENQAMADKRIPELLRIPAACHGLSLEPLLGPVDLSKYLWDGCGDCDPCIGGRPDQCAVGRSRTCNLHWAISGCESGPKRRPCDPAWQESIAEQGKAAGVAVFTKQVSIGGKVSHDPQEWPAALRVQEWPEGF
jgi:protein gp37